MSPAFPVPFGSGPAGAAAWPSTVAVTAVVVSVLSLFLHVIAPDRHYDADPSRRLLPVGPRHIGARLH